MGLGITRGPGSASNVFLDFSGSACRCAIFSFSPSSALYSCFFSLPWFLRTKGKEWLPRGGGWPIPASPKQLHPTSLLKLCFLQEKISPPSLRQQRDAAHSEGMRSHTKPAFGLVPPSDLVTPTVRSALEYQSRSLLRTYSSFLKVVFKHCKIPHFFPIS